VLIWMDLALLVPQSRSSLKTSSTTLGRRSRNLSKTMMPKLVEAEEEAEEEAASESLHSRSFAQRGI
jgi:hypothetical protein